MSSVPLIVTQCGRAKRSGWRRRDDKDDAIKREANGKGWEEKKRRQGVCLACDGRKGERAAARLDAASVARAGLRKRTCNSWKEINHSRLDINNPRLPVFPAYRRQRCPPPPNPATISSLTSFFALSMCVWFFILLLSFFASISLIHLLFCIGADVCAVLLS